MCPRFDEALCTQRFTFQVTIPPTKSGSDFTDCQSEALSKPITTGRAQGFSNVPHTKFAKQDGNETHTENHGPWPCVQTIRRMCCRGCEDVKERQIVLIPTRCRYLIIEEVSLNSHLGYTDLIHLLSSCSRHLGALREIWSPDL